MPLARLENFLKNLSGNTLYVDPNELDATDSIENRGNSRLRPFKTIQRALLEAARFSYVAGSNNDLFDQTTILISPGTHYIDNRPGYYVSGTDFYDVQDNLQTITEFNILSNFDLTDPDNELYKFNSANGGVIIPKGTSLVATDLRKTKIRPLFVPDPAVEEILPTSIFRLTGSCYFFGFSIYDGDPLGKVYNTYSSNTIPSTYSHHKLTAFEYADGVNEHLDTGNTDLEMYYYKVAKGYGTQSSRDIIDGYLNLQPNVDEYRIVGDLGVGSVGITSVRCGDGTNPSNVITVNTEIEHGLSPLTPILIAGVGTNEGTPTTLEYNGNFVVSQVLSPTSFTYLTLQVPTGVKIPSSGGATVKTISDTTTSSSPYVFNCSLKSVYGMNGLHADGSKSTGFRSIVTAQFTGISLQKDDRAFVKYDPSTGNYQDQSSFSGGSTFLHQEIDSIYKPDWSSFHIKASNDAFIQCVSIFAIGYANQFVAQEGGDQSITNSNSNFGQRALSSEGFKKKSYPKDDHGFITHIIPPKDVSLVEQNIDTYAINSSLPNSTSKVYIQGYNDVLNPPKSKLRGYSVGGKLNDKIYYVANNTEYSATINPNFKIQKNITSIDLGANLLTLESVTGITTGLPVKIISSNGLLPDGIENNLTYYIRTVSGNDVRIFENLTNCYSNTNPVDITSSIGMTSYNLYISSKVSDLSSGDVGSPIQWDDTVKNWYIGISAVQSFVDNLTEGPTVYLKRVIDTRSNDDKIYRIRYVVPKESTDAATPATGFVFQKSSRSLNSSYPTSTDSSLSSLSAIRNKNAIIDAYYSASTATIVTKNPHNLKVGNKVAIYNLKSSNEPSPVGLGTGTGFNGEFIVSSVIDDVTFTYSSSTNPGTITQGSSGVSSWYSSVTSSYKAPPYTIYTENRTNLPYFVCEQVEDHFQVNSVKQIQKYVENSSDGIYQITLNAYKNTPLSSPFNTSDFKFGQNLDLIYPQIDSDNLIVDPDPATSVASRKTIGKVEVNDPYLSTTKESIIQYIKDFNIGKQITNFTKSGNNVTITTAENHGLAGIRKVTVNTAGTGYTDGTYYDIPLFGGTGSSATVNVTVLGGSPTTFEIANPGSGYVVGDVLQVRGIPGSTNTTSVNVSLLNFNASNSDLIQVLGAPTAENNGPFIISSVTKNTITYVNASGVSESGSNAVVVMSGVGYPISSNSYNSGISTVTTTYPHSLSIGNKVIFSDTSIGICTVTSVPSTSSFTVNANSGSSTRVYSIGLVPTLKDTNSINENLNTRNFVAYNDYKSRVIASVSNSDTSLNILDIEGLKKGDFVQIENEIMLITRIYGGSASVSRGLFGTEAVAHPNNSLIKTISILPVELRRPSILRASGHTFEYTGFGPGNYSTGMPSNQTKVLTDDEIVISQSLSNRGGSVFYSGMNSNGEFYIGRRKWDAASGKEIQGAFGTTAGAIDLSNLDEITVNKITVNQEIDASTATEVVKELTVNNNLTVNGIIDGDLKYSVSDGNGLTGGSFNNTGDVTLELGTPSGITSTSTNSVTATSHTHELSNGAVTAPKLSGGQTGTAPVYGIRAWVTFNGTTAVTDANRIISSGNIATVTRISKGTYEITFNPSTPMPNTNYAVNVTVGVNVGVGLGDNPIGIRVYRDTMTTTKFRMFTSIFDPGESGNDQSHDYSFVSVMVLG